MAKDPNTRPAGRKSRRKIIPTPVTEITPEQLEQALALARSQPDRPQKSVASFEDVTGDTWAGHLFRSQLAQTHDILEIKRCADVLLATLISSIGLEEARKLWSVPPPVTGGVRDPALDRLMVANYHELHSEHPDWKRGQIMAEVAKRFGKSVSAVERRIGKLIRK